MRPSRLTTALFALAFLFTVAPRAEAHHPSRDRRADILDTAVGAGGFETLVAAVRAAGLVETLKGPGPFTVFAPTDEAFAALPPGTVESLLEPANREALRAVLTYHVVAGRVPAATAGALRNADTVNGQRVGIKVEEGRLKIDQATVQSADIGASNGIIHVIDKVLLPADKNIVTLAQGGYDLPPAARTALETSLGKAARETDDRARAWALRYGLDDARQALRERIASRGH